MLVISCPCALVVSIPLGYFGGIGGASRNSILVKGANYIDALKDVGIVVLDKTGTLTKGVFRVTQVEPRGGFSADQLLALAASAESHSNHPIARSIREAFGKPVPESVVESYQERKGYGVIARIDGKRVLAGNDRLLHLEGIAHSDCGIAGTTVYIAVDDTFAGYLVISDERKEEAAGAIREMKRLGVRRVLMLTGDNGHIAAGVARDLGLDGYYADLLPEEKVEKIEEIRAEARRGELVAFVGDGINDAPVIMRADIGFAMGAMGSDAAIEAADVVLMDDSVRRVPEAIRIARFTRNVVMQNIVFALTVKLAFVVPRSGRNRRDVGGGHRRHGRRPRRRVQRDPDAPVRPRRAIRSSRGRETGRRRELLIVRPVSPNPSSDKQVSLSPRTAPGGTFLS